MRAKLLCITLAGLTASLLVACGGGGGNGPGVQPPGPNQSPTANAGATQSVNSGVTVTLDGSASSDPDGSIASYLWTQTAGAAVTLSGASTSRPTFPAPQVVAATDYTFSLVVTDNRGATSAAATTTVTVNPAAAGNTTVTGAVTFGRVPIAAGANSQGLQYGAVVQQPARGVLVQALDAGSQALLASGTSDSAGNYSLSVPNNTSIVIKVVAQMVRTGTPAWNMTVRDGLAGTPYSYSDPASFNSSAGTAHNVAIPTGISATGTATGARASGPFAILDTAWRAKELIVGADANIVLPTLIFDWGAQTDGTFFTSDPSQHIALLSDLASDTDEFDQHVIAHEFGHYIEFNFSRADNIGGSHAIGDKLDARVAFGEGFGYAFAAMVMNDPIAKDSINSGLGSCTNLCAGFFNIESNPPSNPAGVTNGNYGCWCSESSVWSILWDIFDTAADPNDTLSIGFQPIWNVLVNNERVTPAFTTIFSFVKGLKDRNTASPNIATGVDTLAAAQNISTITDEYATGESHFPNPPVLTSTAVLPLYSVIAGTAGSVTVRSSDDTGNYNKLGNHRFVRYTLPANGNHTVSLTGTGADPDLVIYRNGQFLKISEEVGNEINVPITLAGDYLFDVYECSNGCTTTQGTPGDYDLTVTVN